MLERTTAASSEDENLADLRARYPDLADKVVEGELTLEGARAEAEARPFFIYRREIFRDRR